MIKLKLLSDGYPKDGIVLVTIFLKQGVVLLLAFSLAFILDFWAVGKTLYANCNHLCLVLVLTFLPTCVQNKKIDRVLSFEFLILE